VKDKSVTCINDICNSSLNEKNNCKNQVPTIVYAKAYFSGSRSFPATKKKAWDEVIILAKQACKKKPCSYFTRIISPSFHPFLKFLILF